MSALSVTYEDIVAAQQRITNTAHVTPVMHSAAADVRAGAQLLFKCEIFQRVGAFKFRGAYNALSQFDAGQRERGVVAYSSGNHAQAIALAANLLRIPAVVVMPTDAAKIKMTATLGYGAEVVTYDRYTEDRDAIGAALARQRGLTLIPPFDHPHVIAGQGTVAKELLDQVGILDVLVTPLGGGGLLSGCAIAARELNPDCTIVGVEPEAGNDGQQSFRSGQIVRIATPATIADGAQTQFLGQHTFPIIRELVDDILTVTDAELVETMSFLAGRMKIFVEPTGCLAAAAVLSGKLPVAGKRVGIVLSGGNVDVARFAELVGSGG
jgi:threo-3-hydroxy-L-aspartate ammonia-lyase